MTEYRLSEKMISDRPFLEPSTSLVMDKVLRYAITLQTSLSNDEQKVFRLLKPDRVAEEPIFVTFYKDRTYFVQCPAWKKHHAHLYAAACRAQIARHRKTTMALAKTEEEAQRVVGNCPKCGGHLVFYEISNVSWGVHCLGVEKGVCNQEGNEWA